MARNKKSKADENSGDVDVPAGGGSDTNNKNRRPSKARQGPSRQASFVEVSKVRQQSEQPTLVALQRLDKEVCKILHSSTFVVFYALQNGAWVREDVEGPLFVVERLTIPRHVLVVLNRLNPTNRTVPVTKDMELEIRDQYLFLQNGSDVHGLWFFQEGDAKRIGEEMDNLIDLAAEAKSTEHVSHLHLHQPVPANPPQPMPTAHQDGGDRFLQILQKAGLIPAATSGGANSQPTHHRSSSAAAAAEVTNPTVAALFNQSGSTQGTNVSAPAERKTHPRMMSVTDLEKKLAPSGSAPATTTATASTALIVQPTSAPPSNSGQLLLPQAVVGSGSSAFGRSAVPTGGLLNPALLLNMRMSKSDFQTKLVAVLKVCVVDTLPRNLTNEGRTRRAWTCFTGGTVMACWIMLPEIY